MARCTDKRIETTYTIELTAAEVEKIRDILSTLQGPTKITSDLAKFFYRVVANMEP